MRPFANFVEARGGQLYYESNRSGDANVPVHRGTPEIVDNWTKSSAFCPMIIGLLGTTWRISGPSSLPTEDEPYSNYEDLAALRDHLGFKTAQFAE